jgi:hypothetical protein
MRVCILALFLTLSFGVRSGHAQALGGNEVVAGTALNIALRAPFVARRTKAPLRVTVMLFNDSTLTDSVPAHISPSTFTLTAGASQTVRLRLRTKPDRSARMRLGTTFLPEEEEKTERPTMRFVLAVRILTRVIVE